MILKPLSEKKSRISARSVSGKTAGRSIPGSGTDTEKMTVPILYYDRSTISARSSPLSYDTENAEELWDESMRLTGLDQIPEVFNIPE